jgi:uncharacterized membrane protein YfcA
MGFATTCLPILALTMGLEVALPLVLVPSVANNIIVQIEVGHFRDSMSRFWPLIVAGMAGVVIGLVLLTWMEARLAAAVLGVVLIVYGLFALKTPNLTMPPRLEKPLAPITGLATGIVNGLTGSQLMPVCPICYPCISTATGSCRRLTALSRRRASSWRSDCPRSA